YMNDANYARELFEHPNGRHRYRRSGRVSLQQEWYHAVYASLAEEAFFYKCFDMQVFNARSKRHIQVRIVPIKKPASKKSLWHHGGYEEMNILDDLEYRGLVNQVSDEEALKEKLEKGPITLY